MILIVDDDASVRFALAGLFRSVGLDATLFSTADEFLSRTTPDQLGCLILDMRLPSVSGLDLYARVLEEGFELPVIFITGHGDIPMSVRAMKIGAADFLTKPFRDQDLLDAVNAAVATDASRRADADIKTLQRALCDSLTAREREVLDHVCAGLMNKQIAGLMMLSEVTVKVHRARVMRKMKAKTLADLVRTMGVFNSNQPREKANSRVATMQFEA